MSAQRNTLRRLLVASLVSVALVAALVAARNSEEPSSGPQMAAAANTFLQKLARAANSGDVSLRRSRAAQLALHP